MTEETTTDPLQRFVNPATVRGLGFVAAGVFILAFPDASGLLIGLVVAGALVVTGVTDIWGEIRATPTSWRGIAVGIGYLAASVFVVAFGDQTLIFITRVFAVVVAVRGAVTGLSGISSRRTNSSWLYDVVRGLFMVAVGIMVFFTPEALLSFLLITGAVVVIVTGAVIIAYGIENPDEEELRADRLGGLIKRWIDDRDLGDRQRDELVDSLYFEPPERGQKERAFWAMLILSVVIATLGVLADSTAVVIGAMLVAPLMTPIMGASAAIVNGWTNRVSRSFTTVAGGVAVAVGVAWIVAVWTPQLVPLETNSQILSRTSPTMIDLMIAIAAGAAGAYATVDKRVSSSITGVAIAVALVPPLGVVGILLQAGEIAEAWGAFLLFLTNFVSIVLVAGIVFVLMGLAPIEEIQVNRRKMGTVIATVGLGAILVIVPLAFTSEGIIASASRQATTQDVVKDWIEDEPGLRVARVEVDGSDVSVRISGEGDVPSIDTLEQSLEEELGVDVTVTVEYFPSVYFDSERQ